MVVDEFDALTEGVVDCPAQPIGRFRFYCLRGEDVRHSEDSTTLR